jgi:23S rRNA (adenine2030-N6)-methyltransferase
MNYRHSFHAGNFGDVLKHAVLAALVERFKRKDAPFSVTDSHAGAGLYDLAGGDATRTGEYQHGIARLLARSDAPAALAPYLDTVRALNRGALNTYPGSPEIVRRLLRPDDRLIAVETVEDVAADLRRVTGRDERVAVHRRDGYEALKALLPPTPRRGFVLIDPPYEAADEWQRLDAMLGEIARRWPTGTILVWYPIKDRKGPDGLLKKARAMGHSDTVAAELMVQEADDRAMNGAGLLAINAPWRMEDDLKVILPYLSSVLARGRGAGHKTIWLKRPA